MTDNTRAAAFALVLVATGIAAARFPVSAQAAHPDDMLPALLVEMKGLRAAMEQMASGGIQAQMLVGRLQVQETRVTSMIDRHETVRNSLAMARDEYDRMRNELQLLEKEDAPGRPQADKDSEVSMLKAQLAGVKAHVDSLIAEEMELAADLAVEQQRWIAISQRLDELERALAKR